VSHLKSYRQGWNHERFAKFIVGKLAFISSPSSTGDDTGTDVSGFFIKDHPTKKGQIVPDLSFVMQVKPPSWKKSKKFPRYVQDRVRELGSFTVPFYISIVNPKTKELNVYSGQGLAALFALESATNLAHQIEKGEATIRCEIVDSIHGMPARRDGNSFTIIFYKVATLGMESGFDSPEALEWRRDCFYYTKTIESSSAGEFIFRGVPMPGAQWLGIGTYLHALRRNMHSAYILSEFVHSQYEPGVTPNDRMTRLIHALAESALQVDDVYNLFDGTPLREEIISSQEWTSWLFVINAVYNNHHK
jgi:hypothetical protein